MRKCLKDCSQAGIKIITFPCHASVNLRRIKLLLISLFLNLHLSIFKYWKHARSWLPSRRSSLKWCVVDVCSYAHYCKKHSGDNKAMRVLGQTEAVGWHWQDFHFTTSGLEFWKSYKQLQQGLMAHFMTYFVWIKLRRRKQPMPEMGHHMQYVTPGTF